MSTGASENYVATVSDCSKIEYDQIKKKNANDVINDGRIHMGYFIDRYIFYKDRFLMWGG